MGNPRRHRKARSSAHKTVKHSRHAKRNLKKMKPIRGPRVLQDNWDKSKTVRQNYAAMGLLGSMKQADSGGSEHLQPEVIPSTSAEAGPSPLSGTSKSANSTIPQRFGKILRDADGNVLGFELPEEKAEEEESDKDPEMADEDITNSNRKTDVVAALEGLAESSGPVPRFASSGELAALRKLIAKHGRDFEAMATDRRLNEWQRTSGQLQRAVTKAGLV